VKPRVAAAAAAAAAAARRRCVGQWCGECLLYADSVVVSPGCDVRRALCWKGEDERGDGSGRRRMLIRGRWSHRSCLTAGVIGLAAPGFPESLGVRARQVARLLVVCGVGNGECRGQLIQERKPRPMLAVCQLAVSQLTDVRGACEAGRKSGWSALCWTESQPRKRPVRTVASRIVSVLGAECVLDPRESVLFIGTQFSNLYTAVDTPARGRCTTVSLSEVSDWMEQSAHVIRICGERYTPPHKWSHLRGAAKLWSASAVRDLSGLENPGPKLGPSTMCQGAWVLWKQRITSWLNPHGVVRCIQRTTANCTRLWRRLRVKREIIWQSGTACARPKLGFCSAPAGFLWWQCFRRSHRHLRV
jgi:hypothetical protein